MVKGLALSAILLCLVAIPSFFPFPFFWDYKAVPVVTIQIGDLDPINELHIRITDLTLHGWEIIGVSHHDIQDVIYLRRPALYRYLGLTEAASSGQ